MKSSHYCSLLFTPCRALAARHPANKVTFAVISSPSPKATKNGLDTVTGAPKGCEQ